MKYITLLLVIAFCSCNNGNPIRAIEPSELQTIVFDSCEYVVRDVPYGHSITHKGNCKYCLQRDSAPNLFKTVGMVYRMPDSVLSIKKQKQVSVQSTNQTGGTTGLIIENNYSNQ